MVERCREETGVPIEMAEVRAIAERSIGRPHLARILVEKGIVRDKDEAFSTLIGDDRPCYVPIEKAPFREVVRATSRSRRPRSARSWRRSTLPGGSVPSPIPA